MQLNCVIHKNYPISLTWRCKFQSALQIGLHKILSKWLLTRKSNVPHCIPYNLVKKSLCCKHFYVLQWFFMVSIELTLVSRKLYLVRVLFLSQSFTILKNMFSDLNIYVFIIFFCVFNCKSTEVGYRNLTERTLSGQSANF